MSLRDKEVGVVVKFCAKCQSLLDNWELPENRSYRRHDNHYEFNALEASAKGGCQLCSLFVAGFSEHALRTLRSEPEPRKISVEIRKGLSPHYYLLRAMDVIHKVSWLSVTAASRPGKI
jgi:hypothetical protein